jgi:tuftelin-interacting protein 11
MRTEDSKREARRRGEIVSDSEEEEAPHRRGRGKGKAKGKQDKPEVDQSWRKQRKVKVKVEHKTYEQLVAEAGEGTAAGVGLVIDARGGEVSPNEARKDGRR